MAVGENIRRIRISKGLTQKQLGELCGMADSAIRRYELGKANPKIETIEKIAKALNVNAFELLGFNAAMDIAEDIILKKNTTLKELYKAEELIDMAGEEQMQKYPHLVRLASAFDCLNDLGKEIAIERVEELTEIEKYSRINEKHVSLLKTYSNIFKQNEDKHLN